MKRIIRTIDFLIFAFLLLPAESSFSQNVDVPVLITVTNPTPEDSDLFGGAVAALGDKRVVVGAEGASEAYLFNLRLQERERLRLDRQRFIAGVVSFLGRNKDSIYINLHILIVKNIEV